MDNKIIFKKNLTVIFCFIILFIFLSEFVIMYGLVAVFNNYSFLIQSILDALVLSIISSPILYFFGFRHFILEVDRYKELEKKYKSLFDFSEEAMMTLYPPDWRFSDGNPATLKMFGINSDEEFKKITPSDVSPEYQPDGVSSSQKAKEMIDLALEKGQNYFEWTHKKIDGPDFLTTVLLTKVETDNKVYLWAVVRDISKDRESEENDIKLNNEIKKALNESERSNKLMIGRELEMIKLKKEILELKNSTK